MAELYVQGTKELERLCEQAREQGRIALDLEFLRERRYWAQLALVQLRVGDESRLLDPLGKTALEPLDELVADPEVVKVLHAPMQDLEIFLRRSGREPARIFDTQTAAAYLGLGAQLSLGALVEAVLGIHLEKGEGFTNWLQRPLTPAQEQYALGDVAHLFELHDEMGRQLDELGRRASLEEELAAFEHAETFLPSPRTAFLRLRRQHLIRGRARAVARELAAWREEEARRRDRPRRTVISDEVVAELARTTPNTEQGLRQTRGLDGREVARSAPAMLEAIARGLGAPESDWPEDPAPPAALAVQHATAVLRAALTALCAEARIEPHLVAADDELRELVEARVEGREARPDLRCLQGWREELAGGRLRDFLAGRAHLGFDPETAAVRFVSPG